MHRARSIVLRMGWEALLLRLQLLCLLRLHLSCQLCTLLSRRSCPNSFPSSSSTAEGNIFGSSCSCATVAVPSDFLQKAPMQQSSLLAFAAVGAGTTGYCQPLDIAAIRVFQLKQILHHVMTVFFTGGTHSHFLERETVICGPLRAPSSWETVVSTSSQCFARPRWRTSSFFSALLVSTWFSPISLFLNASCQPGGSTFPPCAGKHTHKHERHTHTQAHKHRLSHVPFA